MIITKALIRSSIIWPNKLAILDDDYQFTYKQLANRTAKLKSWLKKNNVKKGDRVGVLMLNDFRYIELFYACTAIGAIIVPLNYRLSPEELKFTLNDSGALLLFIHKEYEKVVPFLQINTPSIEQYILADEEMKDSELLSYENIIKNEPDTELEYDVTDEDNIAGLFYTGGTTGRSKGVMLTHRNMVSNFYQTIQFTGLDHTSTYLHSAPMFHLADATFMINAIMVGCTHTFLRMFTPKLFIDKVQKNNVTDSVLVPTMLNMVVNDPGFNGEHLKSLKKILYGASPMPYELLKKIQHSFPKLQFEQAYGMTEASPCLTYLTAEDHITDGTEQSERRLKSAGRVVFGVDLRVVDEHGVDVKPGETGEIIARGQNIMKGYWNLPVETTESLKDGWYHSGDMATIDEDNYIYIVDRKKDMIITGGENVYSTEVENVLYKHQDVIEASVIGVPDERWGEAVLAIVVKEPKSSITENELIQFTKRFLANYKVPKSIYFTDEIPKTAAGKILKRNLRDQFWKDTTRQVN